MSTSVCEHICLSLFLVLVLLPYGYENEHSYKGLRILPKTRVQQLLLYVYIFLDCEVNLLERAFSTLEYVKKLS